MTCRNAHNDFKRKLNEMEKSCEKKSYMQNQCQVPGIIEIELLLKFKKKNIKIKVWKEKERNRNRIFCCWCASVLKRVSTVWFISRSMNNKG
jgi:hypothetical protein